jgi:hypothetical protein
MSIFPSPFAIRSVIRWSLIADDPNGSGIGLILDILGEIQ